MPKRTEEIKPHSGVAKLLHWGFVGVFGYALTKQLDEVEELEDLSLLQQEMAFAAAFLFLLAVRFAYMRSRPTALPPDTPSHLMLAARSVHVAMYVGISLIAASGLLIGGLYWSGVKSGIVMEMALLLHEIAVNASYCLILCHVAAAIYHRRKDDGIWRAMMFSRTERTVRG